MNGWNLTRPQTNSLRYKPVSVFRQTIRRGKEESANSRKTICQLIWQARQVVEFAVDADGRDDWVWPALAQAFKQARGMAQQIGHRNGVTHRRLMNRKGLVPL